MQTLTIRRPLDAGERFFWLLDRVSGMNFTVFAEIAGKVDPQRLQSALTLAQQAHPLLRVTVAVREPDELWFEPVETALSFESIAVTGANWQAPIEAELSHVFEPGAAPLMRCRHLSFSDNERSVLALTFHHAIADGRSGTALLREILHYLAQPDASSHFTTGAIHPAMHSVFPAEYRWQEQPEAAAALHATRKAELKRYGRPSDLPWLAQQHTQRLPRFARIALDVDATARLLRQCKQNGATLHGALSAAQLLAKYRTLAADAPHTLSLGSPADMRPYLAADVPSDSLGLYVTLLFATYQVGGGQTFWELAREVSADLKRQLARGDGHLLFSHVQPQAFAPTAEGIAAFSSLMLASPQSSMISNIGVVDTVTEKAKVEAISFVLCPMPYQMVFSAVSTYAGRLLINMAYDGAKLEEAKAVQLAQWLKEALMTACEE